MQISTGKIGAVQVFLVSTCTYPALVHVLGFIHKCHDLGVCGLLLAALNIATYKV